MKFLITIASILAFNLAYSQGFTKEVEHATKGDSFNSLAYSSINDNLYITSSPVDSNNGGVLTVYDAFDSLLRTIHFPTGGRICLDETGELGAYISDNNKVRFINQKTLTVIDSVTVPSLYGYKKVWFTRSGVIIGGLNSNYKYDLTTHKVSEITMLNNYRVFDYDYASDRMLVGFWNAALQADIKINTIFFTTSLNVVKKKMLSITPTSALYVSFMDSARSFYVQDLKRVYLYDFDRPELKVIINEHLNAVKSNDKSLVVISPYRGACNTCKMSNTFLTYDVTKESIVDTHDIKESPSINIVDVPSKKVMYYLTTGTENSVIAIR